MKLVRGRWAVRVCAWVVCRLSACSATSPLAGKHPFDAWRSSSWLFAIGKLRAPSRRGSTHTGYRRSATRAHAAGGCFVAAWVMFYLTTAHVCGQTSSTWINGAGGMWHEPANWQGEIPNAAGAIAVFESEPQHGVSVTLDEPITLGTLDVAAGRQFTLDGSAPLSFDAASNASAAVHLDSEAQLTIEIPLNLNLLSPLELVLHPTAHLTFNGSVNGAGGMSVSGGTVTLTAAGDFTGPVLVDHEGTLRVTDSAALGTNGRSHATFVGSAGRLHFFVSPGQSLDTSETIYVDGGLIEFHVDSSLDVELKGPLISPTHSPATLRIPEIQTASHNYGVTLRGGADLAGDLNIEFSRHDDDVNAAQGSLRFRDQPVRVAGTLSIDNDLSFIRGVTQWKSVEYSVPVTAKRLWLGDSGATRIGGDGQRFSFGSTHVEFNDIAHFQQIEMDGLSIGGEGTIISSSPDLEISKGLIRLAPGGQFSGIERITKYGSSQARITNLGGGDASMQIDIHRGLVYWADDDYVGQVTASVHAREQAALMLAGNFRGDVELNNARGMLLMPGALYGKGQLFTLSGNVSLGDQGAWIGGLMTIDGVVSGGDLTVVGNVILSGRQEYHGVTHVLGLNSASANLILNGPLVNSTEIILDRGNIQGNLDHCAGVDTIRMRHGSIVADNGGVLQVLSIEEGLNNFTRRTTEPIVLQSLRHTGNSQLNIVATHDVPGHRGFELREPPELSEGLVGAWATFIDQENFEFASFDHTTGMLVPLPDAGRPTQLVGSSDSDNVRATGALQPLTRATTVHSLIIFNDDPFFSHLDLNGQRLTINSGGLILGNRHSQEYTIANGELTTPNDTLYLVGGSQFRLSAALVDSGEPMSVVYSGRIILDTPNSYSGDSIIRGEVIAEHPDALPRTGLTHIDGGDLEMPDRQAAVFEHLRLSDNGHLDATAVMADVFEWQGGTVRGRIVGDGQLVKSSPDTIRITWRDAMSDFSGPIDVREGTLVASGRNGMVGSGSVTVREDGHLVLLARAVDASTTVRPPTDIPNAIFVDGGMLAAGRGELSRSSKTDSPSQFNFLGPITLSGTPRILTHGAGFLDPMVGEIDGEAHIAPSKTELRFLGQVTLQDRTRVQMEGPGLVELRGETVVGGDVQLQLTEGDLLFQSTIAATGARASIDIIQSPKTTAAWNASLRIPSGTDLAVYRNGVRGVLDQTRADQSIEGAGIVQNDLWLSGGATIDPGDPGQVGVLTIGGNLTLGESAVYKLSVRQASSGDGAAFADSLSLTGDLAVAAAQENPWRLVIGSVDGQGAPAALDGFRADGHYSWKIAAARQIRGFDPTTAEIDVNSFAQFNPIPATAGFSLRQRINELWLDYGGPNRCDLDGDGVCSVQDIDHLSAQIVAGAFDATLDLNQNGLLDADDRRVWIEREMNSYFGDSNLDGRFDSSDLVATFQAGGYEDDVAGNSTWIAGDWNGDSEFTSSDLVWVFQRGGYEASSLGGVAAVPEPAS